MVPMMSHHRVPCLRPHLSGTDVGLTHGDLFLGLLEAGSSGDVASMLPSWQILWRATRGAANKVSARPARGASRRD